MTASGCPVHEGFDPLAPEFLTDPYAVLTSLPLDEAPLFYAPSIGYYVLTRYADIEQVFRDPATFSAAAAQAPLVPLVPEAAEILLAGGHRPQPSMVSLDEPAHTRLRRPAAHAFSMTRVLAMIPAIEKTAARLLDAVAGQDEFDLVAALAFPLPANIVFSLIGVPENDFAQLKQWCGSRAALSWGRPAPADQVEIATSIAAYRRYLRDLVDLRAGQPGDDLTTALLAIHREDPDRLTREEISSILFSLSFAGHETTTGLIGNTMRRLLEEPSRWARVAEQRDLIPAAVEETLRYDPSVPVWRRVTTRPVTIGGVDLPEGARLFLWLAAGGRDGAVFPEPDRFDLDRANSGQHLAFGLGLHYCLGANLGRLETRLALEELARRYPRLRLAGDQEFTFHPNMHELAECSTWGNAGRNVTACTVICLTHRARSERHGPVDHHRPHRSRGREHRRRTRPDSHRKPHPIRRPVITQNHRRRVRQRGHIFDSPQVRTRASVTLLLPPVH